MKSNIYISIDEKSLEKLESLEYCIYLRLNVETP